MSKAAGLKSNSNKINKPPTPSAKLVIKPQNMSAKVIPQLLLIPPSSSHFAGPPINFGKP